MSSVVELIRSSSESWVEGYSGVEKVVRGQMLPGDYWRVVQASDGFSTENGFFRFFSVAEVVSRNEAEWVAAYGRILDGFVFVAEDIFGDLYGYAFDVEGGSVLTKLFCEGGGREACEPGVLADFLRERVFSGDPAAFDAGLAERALLSGIAPSGDEHLAFTLPLVAGGEYALENLSVEPVALHLGVLGQMSLANLEASDGALIGGFREE